MTVVDASSPLLDSPRYGRFLRRLQAAIIDGIVIMLAIFSAVFIAVTLNSESLARTLGFSVAIGWLLYEPLLVAFTGSTAGHYLRNLRVVDNQTGGNISFLKAILRTFLKAVLGWLSFITMATTRRHQAVHDPVTKSTVQIRNLALASPHEYQGEQLELSRPGMPSPIRRLAVIVLYLIAATVVFGVLAVTAQMVLMSPACLYQERCTSGEQTVAAGLGLTWIVASVLFIVLGWRGHLIGARKRA